MTNSSNINENRYYTSTRTNSSITSLLLEAVVSPSVSAGEKGTSVENNDVTAVEKRIDLFRNFTHTVGLEIRLADTIHTFTSLM